MLSRVRGQSCSTERDISITIPSVTIRHRVKTAKQTGEVILPHNTVASSLWFPQD